MTGIVFPPLAMAKFIAPLESSVQSDTERKEALEAVQTALTTIPATATLDESGRIRIECSDTNMTVEAIEAHLRGCMAAITLVELEKEETPDEQDFVIELVGNDDLVFGEAETPEVQEQEKPAEMPALPPSPRTQA